MTKFSLLSCFFVDFDVEKYKKMLKFGQPEESVKNRIRQDGFDESFFEMYVKDTVHQSKRRIEYLADVNFF